MAWDPITQPISYATVSNKTVKRRTPGITTVEGNDGSPRKWDEVTGYGFSGSTLRFTGLGLAKFDMVISLYTKEDWKAWREEFLPLVKAPPLRQRPRAFDIWHPFLADYDIKSAVVLNLGLPKMTEEGLTQILIPWQAWRAVKFQLAKVEGAAAPPQDEFEKKLAEKAAYLERIANQ